MNKGYTYQMIASILILLRYYILYDYIEYVCCAQGAFSGQSGVGTERAVIGWEIRRSNFRLGLRCLSPRLQAASTFSQVVLWTIYSALFAVKSWLKVQCSAEGSSMPKKSSESPSKADRPTQLPQNAEKEAPAFSQQQIKSTTLEFPLPRNGNQNHSRQASPKNPHTSDLVARHNPNGSFDNTERSETEQMRFRRRRQWHHTSAWSCSPMVLCTTLIATTIFLIIVHAFLTRQLDPKGCDMCWSRPMYVHHKGFDTEHTRFASKYGLYIIKEGGVDEDERVSSY